MSPDPPRETPDNPAETPPRLGPRPLPLHLLSAGMTWQISKLALPFLKSGSTAWKEGLGAQAQALARDVADVAPAEFAKAVDSEILRRADRLLTGVERYRTHPYRRTLAEPPVLWSEGTTRLLDYGGGAQNALTVLVVPSLINRAYVMDLTPEISFLRYLAATGLRPLLVDWGRPGETEREFDLTDYVAGRLDQAFEAATEAAGGPISVIGYCMGGTLALALAERRQREINGLVLIAAPWDFHAGSASSAQALGALSGQIDASFAAHKEIPTDILQTLFFMVDPQLVIRKFSRFSTMDPDSPAAQRFVATEDWLNDGVPLSLPTARDCLDGWYRRNDPGNGRWKIAGRKVDPKRFRRPAMVVIATGDRLVPAPSSRALAAQLAQAETLEQSLGHIGLMTATRAKSEIWTPIRQFLERLRPA